MINRRLMRRTLPYAVVLITAAGSTIAAQKPAPAPVAHPALSGFWVLSDANPGGGKAAEQVEVVPMGGAPRPGTGATDGAGTGVTGGRGGFVPGGSGASPGDGTVHGGFTDWGNRLPSTKPKRLSAAEALRKEVLTPPESLSIELSRDAVVITDAAIGPVKYKINGKSEAHQLTNGSVKTKTSWDGPLLRQVIDAGRGSKLARVFELTEDGLLRITVGETGALPMQFAVVPEGQGHLKPISNETRKSIYKRKG
jgi:hypothetical protein